MCFVACMCLQQWPQQWPDPILRAASGCYNVSVFPAPQQPSRKLLGSVFRPHKHEYDQLTTSPLSSTQIFLPYSTLLQVRPRHHFHTALTTHPSIAATLTQQDFLYLKNKMSRLALTLCALTTEQFGISTVLQLRYVSSHKLKATIHHVGLPAASQPGFL